MQMNKVGPQLFATSHIWPPEGNLRLNFAEMELMRKMVTWNAASRSTAAECLRHSYFASLVMENGESINYTPNQDFEDWRIPSPTFWSGEDSFLQYCLPTEHYSTFVVCLIDKFFLQDGSIVKLLISRMILHTKRCVFHKIILRHQTNQKSKTRQTCTAEW